ncbi:ventral anterior homeobox 1b-like [Bombyx mandarina]|uniref:Ventral anterior homeobox 1b-like n=1 Tax=Bombyx mandarina TaxID=7092 RepID=A0A6J2JA11_BOMMA|nr:ventral anterior homeobox 1b-like [Bombyx mandarina]
MFHNMLLTALTPHSNTYENNPWKNQHFATLWPAIPENVTKNESSKPRKYKSKRVRTSFTWDQQLMLEETFEKTQYITGIDRRELAQKLGIGEKCIKIWFQNRRMKNKRKSSESSDSYTEAECSSTSDIPKPVHARISSAVNMTFPHNEYVLPSNVGRNLFNIAQGTQFIRPSYDTGFPYDTNMYPTQYYPNNITAYYDSGENQGIQNHNPNNYNRISNDHDN